MSKANVSLEDVSSLNSSIDSAINSLEDISNAFEQKLNELNHEINAEKQTILIAIEKIQNEITKVRNKITKLKIKLESLQVQLAATPPTILVASTDSEGNTTYEEMPNPAYIALLAEISSVENEIERLEGILSILQSLLQKANYQYDLLNSAISSLESLRSDVAYHYSQASSEASDACMKLKNIQVVIEDYKNTKIDAPDLSAFDNSQFKNVDHHNDQIKDDSPEVLTPKSYKADRIKAMYEYVERTYDRTSPEWKECAYRQVLNLEAKQKALQEELANLGDNDKLRRYELEDQLRSINFLYRDLKQSLGDYSSNFVGFKGNNDFNKAYDAFNTDIQGFRNFKVRGDCGIIASQNVVNQQLGIKETELDAINHMRTLRNKEGKSRLVENKESWENGETSRGDRKAFLESKGLEMSYEEPAWFKKIQLDDMLKRYSSGESIMLAVKDKDLFQSELSQRKVTYFDYNKNKYYIVNEIFSNHSVTVAGFTTDHEGKCTGVYINDNWWWN